MREKIKMNRKVILFKQNLICKNHSEIGNNNSKIVKKKLILAKIKDLTPDQKSKIKIKILVNKTNIFNKNPNNKIKSLFPFKMII